uniref:Uncharacterized protein n=1 Tax=Setaria viridis TaxID=4556 RepID=A0A4U6W145_SETVI|nr:hypothetical protein SEVIR_2G342100v2 [Setaria viridis]
MGMWNCQSNILWPSHHLATTVSVCCVITAPSALTETLRETHMFLSLFTTAVPESPHTYIS